MDDTQTRQIFKLAQLRLMIAAATMQALLRKANFNPAQPRIPAGAPGGGRWTDGLLLPASDRPMSHIDLRQEEGKHGAHTIRNHVRKTDSELVARMGPPAKWWQPVKLGVYRNGSFFSLEDANTYVNETLRLHEDTVAKVADGAPENAFLKLRVGRRIGREAFRTDPYSEPVVRHAYEVGVYIEHEPSNTNHRTRRVLSS